MRDWSLHVHVKNGDTNENIDSGTAQDYLELDGRISPAARTITVRFAVISAAHDVTLTYAIH